MKTQYKVGTFLLALMLSLTVNACRAAVQSCQSLDTAAAPAAGNQTLRLDEGEYVITIAGAPHDYSFIDTANVLVRATNARLIMQVSERRCRIAVLSGSAVVKNRIERHIVELRRGAVYTCEAVGGSPATSSCQQIAQSDNWRPLFHTSKFQTSLSVVSPPLLAASKLAPFIDKGELLPVHGDGRTADVQIVSPPTAMSYLLGQDMSHHLALSPLLRQHFPPSGLVVTPVSRLVAEQVTGQAP